MDNYSIKDLINIERLRGIFENFSLATGFTTGFVSYPDQELLITTGWRDICTKFHRLDPASAQYCKKSNIELTGALKQMLELNVCPCDNGLVDGATPVIVDGRHIASVSTGQIFLQPPDLQRFRQQAEKYGYDVNAYLLAVKAVPVVSREQFDKALTFLADIAVMLSELALTNLKLKQRARLLENEIQERKRIQTALMENEEILKTLTQKANMANEAKTNFLATMSHDLRTPLNAVIGFSELALLDSGETALSAKHKENIAHVATAGRHLLSLVEGLLNLGAIESGKITLDKEMIDLNAMLEELSKTFEMLAGKSGINWLSNIRIIKRISADRHRLREVVNNLVSNAMKFTPAAGSITLGAREDDNEVAIFVKDTGCGIEKVDLDEIFKPFVQCKNPGVYSQGKGVGLGLSICRQLVELHGGKLSVESEKGKGSCFTVTLPYAAEGQ